ncbi:TPA: hypothetical protein ACH3X1_006833 [Trebouxia sp. C0004]
MPDIGRQQDAGLQPEDEDMAEAYDPSQDHDSTWRAPQTAVASETYGLLGFFADLEQSAKAPKQHLQQLMPRCDGSVLVKASPLTIEQALAGGAQCHIHASFQPQQATAASCTSILV